MSENRDRNAQTRSMAGAGVSTSFTRPPASSATEAIA